MCFEIKTDTYARKGPDHPANLRKLYVITFISTGDGMLPTSYQEHTVPMP